MSRSLSIFAPAFGGAATILTSAYFLADQFVTDMPAPLRAELVGAANADEGGTATVTEQEVSAAEEVVLAAAEEDAAAQLAASREGGFGLGRAALPEEVAAWDIDVRPDGTGLPEGEGDVWTGEEVFVAQCAVCHGDFGEAVGRWPVLAGGWDSLQNRDPVKTIGSYWPYLSTVYDYVNRAMPFGNAQSLSPDEIYAITAYLLYLNNLVEDDFVLSHENFQDVRLPNEDGFFMDDRAEAEYPVWTGDDVCMENCKESVEITMRAMVLDVTPDDGSDAAASEGDAPDTAAAEGTDTAAEVPVAEEAAATDDPLAGIDLALAEDGEGVFRQCRACHQVGESARNGTGPQLNGVLGRPVGGLDDFRYSGVFQDAREAGEVWTVERLTTYLEDPRGTYQGTRMAFNGLRNAEDIAAVIAYLAAEGGG